MRIVMQIEYDGTHFHGWQSQPGLRTVQGEIEKALSELAQHPVKTICAGRTDTGVHAREQIIHFDTDTIRSEHTWLRGVNHFLPPDISVHNVFFVSEDFHARYSATSRSYEYWIFNSPTPSALKRYSMLWYPQALDEFLMNKAAQHLLGKHNFNAYRAVGCQAKSPIRSISEISVTREENLKSFGECFFASYGEKYCGRVTSDRDWKISCGLELGCITFGTTHLGRHDRAAPRFVSYACGVS